MSRRISVPFIVVSLGVSGALYFVGCGGSGSGGGGGVDSGTDSGVDHVAPGDALSGSGGTGTGGAGVGSGGSVMDAGTDSAGLPATGGTDGGAGDSRTGGTDGGSLGGRGGVAGSTVSATGGRGGNAGADAPGGRGGTGAPGGNGGAIGGRGGLGGAVGGAGGRGGGGAGGLAGGGGRGGRGGRGGFGGFGGFGGAGGITALGGAGGGAAGAGGVTAPVLAAHATITPSGTGTITGTASFMRVPGGVELQVSIASCPSGVHGIQIHEGATCANPGPVFGPARGSNIGAGTMGSITCLANGAGMLGVLDYTRLNSTGPASRWTIDDGAPSDVVGHVIVIDSVPGNTVAGCGVIQPN